MVTEKQYVEFTEKWWKHSNGLTHQRFGQYFCNTFNVTDPILFYEKDHQKAHERIYKQYLIADGYLKEK